eukprot:TRINITY_DN14360_c0_g1_i4.p1 TRINITY_DN14360_c0_g1~~TRINITY_DN14360_c0_g1_i4.p1  ORF type:complete len:319 (+),score=78.14 TRINITY_DN14360_c0_g1_i4:109-1065(+)
MWRRSRPAARALLTTACPLRELPAPPASHRAAMGLQLRCFSTSKRYKIRRVDYPWKMQLQKMSWDFMKQEMVSYFESQPQRDSTVHVIAKEWPPYVMKEELLEAGRIPALITRHGVERRVTFAKEEIERIAFDEPQGHLSHLFKGRLFRVHVGDWIEECYVADCSTHPVEQEIYFVRMHRHVPGKMTTVPIPVSISGLWGCPGYQAGGHVDLSMPTVLCEIVGDYFPPPFVVDVSQLRLADPYGKITLSDIKGDLPADGTVRFARRYTLDEEVVMCYDPKAIGEVPLPADWLDPNFDHRGGRYHLTYTGYFPRQTTRQ